MLLPGYKIGMMLCSRYYHIVPFSDKCLAEGICNQVNGSSGA